MSDRDSKKNVCRIPAYVSSVDRDAFYRNVRLREPQSYDRQRKKWIDGKASDVLRSFIQIYNACSITMDELRLLVQTIDNLASNRSSKTENHMEDSNLKTSNHSNTTKEDTAIPGTSEQYDITSDPFQDSAPNSYAKINLFDENVDDAPHLPVLEASSQRETHHRQGAAKKVDTAPRDIGHTSVTSSEEPTVQETPNRYSRNENHIEDSNLKTSNHSDTTQEDTAIPGTSEQYDITSDPFQDSAPNSYAEINLSNESVDDTPHSASSQRETHHRQGAAKKVDTAPRDKGHTSVTRSHKPTVQEKPIPLQIGEIDEVVHASVNMDKCYEPMTPEELKRRNNQLSEEDWYTRYAIPDNVVAGFSGRLAKFLALVRSTMPKMRYYVGSEQTVVFYEDQVFVFIQYKQPSPVLYAGSVDIHGMTKRFSIDEAPDLVEKFITKMQDEPIQSSDG